MPTSFEIGTRYERPPSEPPSWFHDVLTEVRDERDGDIPIRVEATTGHRVDALLVEGNAAIPSGPHGKVSLNSHGEDLVIGSEMVAAFTLLPGRTAKKRGEKARAERGAPALPQTRSSTTTGISRSVRRW